MNDHIRSKLTAAEHRFEAAPVTIERGLDVSDPALVQLRRACRLLAAGVELLESGYYTVVIESSSVAIERTIQFRLIHDGAMAPEEVISNHRRLYQRGAEIGLYNEPFYQQLAELWNQNRTKTYYRLGIATKEQADAMQQLATAVHHHLVAPSQLTHECLCEP